jgi:hypothetical protein
MDDDEPSISLKLKFDQMTPEVLHFVYLLSILVVTTLVFLILQIVDFAVRKTIKVQRYFTRRNSTSPQMLFD